VRGSEPRLPSDRSSPTGDKAVSRPAQRAARATARPQRRPALPAGSEDIARRRACGKQTLQSGLTGLLPSGAPLAWRRQSSAYPPSTFGRQRGGDSVEQAQADPADKAIMDCLARTIRGRPITPAQSVPDHKDDAAYDPRRSSTRGMPCDSGKRDQSGASAHRSTTTTRTPAAPLDAAIELTDCVQRKQFNRSSA